jgi:hypothetical protein
MTLEQFLNYTLAFFMWLVLGRATLEIITRQKQQNSEQELVTKKERVTR